MLPYVLTHSILFLYSLISFALHKSTFCFEECSLYFTKTSCDSFCPKYSMIILSTYLKMRYGKFYQNYLFFALYSANYLCQSNHQFFLQNTKQQLHGPNFALTFFSEHIAIILIFFPLVIMVSVNPFSFALFKIIS